MKLGHGSTFDLGAVLTRQYGGKDCNNKVGIKELLVGAWAAREDNFGGRNQHVCTGGFSVRCRLKRPGSADYLFMVIVTQHPASMGSPCPYLDELVALAMLGVPSIPGTRVFTRVPNSNPVAPA